MVEVPLTIFLPYGYTITKSQEPYRRGSFVSYDIIPPGNYETPYLQEIQFFTEKSIRDFLAACSGDAPCFFGDYPDLDRYFAQRQAFERRVGFDEYKLLQLGERYYFTSNHTCEGDVCILREYTTFLSEGIKVDIWIIMDDETQDVQSDALISQVLMQE